MKVLQYILAALVIAPLAAPAGNIDPSRMPASGWTGNVGIPGGIPTNYTMYCNVRVSIPGSNLVALGDGVTDDAPAINAAVQNCPNGEYVYIPTGNYRLNETIYRQGVNYYDGVQRPFSVEIKGDGPALTKLFYYGGGDVIQFEPAGGENAQTMTITGGDARGSTQLSIGSISPYLTAPTYAIVHRLNSAAITSGVNGGTDPSYAVDTCSQIVKVTAVSGGTITFTPALNEAYAGDYLTIAISSPYRCGIQDLYLENESDNGADTIHIDCGQECWVQDVESYDASAYHIRLVTTARSQVQECVIHDGWNAGGNADYGVDLFEYSSNNLVQDNIFWDCRHAMPMEVGGQGNVYGYNYNFNPINSDLGPGLTDELNTDYLMGDQLNHGGEPRWNLREGNVAATIKFDCVLGGSAYDTAFRNRIQRKGLPSTIVACFGSDIQMWNYYENLVGNIYELPTVPTALRRWGTNQDDASNPDPQSQATAYLDGEYDETSSTITWASTNQTLPNSYYLTSKPAFFGSMAWPAFDPTNPSASSVVSIPAGYREVYGQPAPGITATIGLPTSAPFVSPPGETVTTPTNTTVVTQTAADTTPPSVPTGLSAVAASYSQVNLTWTASTDNVGVIGYNILRNGTQVGTSPTASYSDTGLSGSTAYSYTVEALDAASNVSSPSSSVSITTPAQPAAPSVSSFGASSATITSGQSTTLSWSVSGSPVPTLSISGVGTVTGTSVSVSPTATTTYTLTATNSAGSATKQVTVTVTAATVAPSISSFSASSTTITSGQSTTLSWSVSGNPAPTLSISGVGTVTGTSVSVSPTATTTYTLTATNSAGSKTAQVTVTVASSSTITTTSSTSTNAPTIYFGATSTSITAGQPSTLSWAVSGSPHPSVSISGIGAISSTAWPSYTVYPSVTTTYTLTATNASGAKTATVTIMVTKKS
jgi:hypothetical protein